MMAARVTRQRFSWLSLAMRTDCRRWRRSFRNLWSCCGAMTWLRCRTCCDGLCRLRRHDWSAWRDAGQNVASTHRGRLHRYPGTPYKCTSSWRKLAWSTDPHSGCSVTYMYRCRRNKQENCDCRVISQCRTDEQEEDRRRRFGGDVRTPWFEKEPLLDSWRADAHTGKEVCHRVMSKSKSRSDRSCFDGFGVAPVGCRTSCGLESQG